MPGPVEIVRDFVLQIEKTLNSRRLYSPASATYREANEKLFEKCRAAVDGDGLTLRIGSADLFLEKISLINRPKREDSFFFGLYRDGLRELTFTPEVTAEDLGALLDTFEVTDQKLGAADDMVNYLWRCDLTTITHSAIDGIGEMDDDGESSGNDFRGLISDLAEKIRNPAPAAVGQKYSFVLDADVRVGATDFHYDATTVRRTFEENNAILRLTEEQTAAIRAELGEDRDTNLVERFIEILLFIIRGPARAIDTAAVAAVFQQLIDAYWTARDYARVAALLTHLRAAANEAAIPERRAAMAELVARFLTDERLSELMIDFLGGALALPLAMRVWDLVPDEQLWPLMISTWSSLPEGETRSVVLNTMRRRASSKVDLVASTLASADPTHVRAALAMLDERTERVFAPQLIALAAHPDESIRLKGLAAASRIGGSAALEALWKTMESDPSKSVRLYAFRAIASSNFPDLVPRLQALVADAGFAARPLWEREKYVRLLGSIAGAAVMPMFEAWIPAKRWFWQPRDLEQLELALRGLTATGPEGKAKVERFAGGGGKPAEVARKVLDSTSRPEAADGLRGRMPTLSTPMPTRTK